LPAGEEVGQECVRQGLGGGFPMADEGVGEAGRTGVDVLVPTFDQTVGVEDRGRAFGEGRTGLRPRDVFKSSTERRVGSARRLCIFFDTSSRRSGKRCRYVSSVQGPMLLAWDVSLGWVRRLGGRRPCRVRVRK